MNTGPSLVQRVLRVGLLEKAELYAGQRRWAPPSMTYPLVYFIYALTVLLRIILLTTEHRCHVQASHFCHFDSKLS
jgi:hypothetical protein